MLGANPLPSLSNQGSLMALNVTKENGTIEESTTTSVEVKIMHTIFLSYIVLFNSIIN